MPVIICPRCKKPDLWTFYNASRVLCDDCINSINTQEGAN